MNTKFLSGLIMLSLSLPLACRAEVSNIAANGFTIRHTVATGATGDIAWKTMTRHVDEWWNPEHSWSGSAANMYIEPKVGGCFCERLPGEGEERGGVEHLRIIYLDPGREIRFDGALGPLQAIAVQGRMIWRIDTDADTGSTIAFTYMVHGFLDGGFAGLAPAVDGVISEQLERLARRLQNIADSDRSD